MPQYIKVAGTWRSVDESANCGYVKVAGTWRQVSNSYVKVAGVWRSVCEPGVVTTTTTTTTLPPSVGLTLTVTDTGGIYNNKLDWNTGAILQTSWELYRYDSFGSSLLAFGSTQTTFTDTNVVCGKQWFYFVKINGTTNSNNVSRTTPACPTTTTAAPTTTTTTTTTTTAVPTTGATTAATTGTTQATTSTTGSTSTTTTTTTTTAAPASINSLGARPDNPGNPGSIVEDSTSQSVWIEWSSTGQTSYVLTCNGSPCLPNLPLSGNTSTYRYGGLGTRGQTYCFTLSINGGVDTETACYTVPLASGTTTSTTTTTAATTTTTTTAATTGTTSTTTTTTTTASPTTAVTTARSSFCSNGICQTYVGQATCGANQTFVNANFENVTNYTCVVGTTTPACPTCAATTTTTVAPTTTTTTTTTAAPTTTTTAAPTTTTTTTAAPTTAATTARSSFCSNGICQTYVGQATCGANQSFVLANFENVTNYTCVVGTTTPACPSCSSTTSAPATTAAPTTAAPTTAAPTTAAPTTAAPTTAAPTTAATTAAPTTAAPTTAATTQATTSSEPSGRRCTSFDVAIGCCTDPAGTCAVCGSGTTCSPAIGGCNYDAC